MPLETASRRPRRSLTAADLGTISNHLRILSDDHRKLRPNELQKVTGLGPVALQATTGIARPMLYRSEVTLRPTSGLTKKIMAFVAASDQAFELFDRNLGETVKWVSSPNAIFFGSSPFEVCMRGEGQRVIEWLNQHLGQGEGAAF